MLLYVYLAPRHHLVEGGDGDRARALLGQRRSQLRELLARSHPRVLHRVNSCEAIACMSVYSFVQRCYMRARACLKKRNIYRYALKEAERQTCRRCRQARARVCSIVLPLLCQRASEVRDIAV